MTKKNIQSMKKIMRLTVFFKVSFLQKRKKAIHKIYFSKFLCETIVGLNMFGPLNVKFRVKQKSKTD